MGGGVARSRVDDAEHGSDTQADTAQYSTHWRQRRGCVHVDERRKPRAARRDLGQDRKAWPTPSPRPRWTACLATRALLPHALHFPSLPAWSVPKPAARHASQTLIRSCCRPQLPRSKLSARGQDGDHAPAPGVVARPGGVGVHPTLGSHSG